MPLIRTLLAFAATSALVALLVTQLDTTSLLWWAGQVQRDIQNAMASAVRDVRAGEIGAILGLCGLTYAYGVIHAIGPGHGKILIGGAAFASRTRMQRLAALTLLSSLGQSVTAILLVLIGAGLITLTSTQLVGLTEETLTPLSYAAIALIGLWMVLRGLRALWRYAGREEDDADAPCGCGLPHGPAVSEIDDAMSLREMTILVLGIALRPCTGAIFLLVICWRLQILPAGILATLVMGLGTASFNLFVAGAGLGLQRMLTTLGPARALTVIAPMAQLTAGLLITVAAWAMLSRAL